MPFIFSCRLPIRRVMKTKKEKVYRNFCDIFLSFIIIILYIYISLLHVTVLYLIQRHGEHNGNFTFILHLLWRDFMVASSPCALPFVNALHTVCLAFLLLIMQEFCNFFPLSSSLHARIYSETLTIFRRQRTCEIIHFSLSVSLLVFFFFSKSFHSFFKRCDVDIK